MDVAGEAYVNMTLNGITKQIRVIISKEMKEEMLISRQDLRTFKVIPQGFPFSIVNCCNIEEKSKVVLDDFDDVATDSLNATPMHTDGGEV